ncbi:jg21682 [Pararge aegeria aegeria]|uniref:Jg21682 protein n=1 Tax=Pararge aegeria aegeria TaxID=348720 RepID=A0A8S4R8L5_9NEOP|nr:jg21682 [Pararge aegeria aegeria]
MDVGVPRCWNGSPVLVSAALVDPQRGGQTTLSASQIHSQVVFFPPIYAGTDACLEPLQAPALRPSFGKLRLCRSWYPRALTAQHSKAYARQRDPPMAANKLRRW